jgi:hypothetical protein
MVGEEPRTDAVGAVTEEAGGGALFATIGDATPAALALGVGAGEQAASAKPRSRSAAGALMGSSFRCRIEISSRIRVPSRRWHGTAPDRQ